MTQGLSPFLRRQALLSLRPSDFEEATREVRFVH